MRRRDLLAAALALPGAARTAPSPALTVAVSFNAVAELTRAVAGDSARVITLVPDGGEVHEFSPTVSTISAIRGSDAVIVNGLGLEPWAERTLTAGRRPWLAAAEGTEGAERADRARLDPHVWLSPRGAADMAGRISAFLGRLRPELSGALAERRAALADGLEAELRRCRERLAGSRGRYLVTGHAAFGWLCRDLGLTQLGVEADFGRGPPSPSRLARLVDLCRREGVGTVFHEWGSSPGPLRALADEIGARVVTLYTMESSEDGRPFQARTAANLAAIAAALG